MPQYIVDLWLDGYDTEAEMEKACDEFIYEQLNFTASSVKVKRSDYAELEARHNALREAVEKEIRAWDNYSHYRNMENAFDSEVNAAWDELDAARAEVDRMISEENK